MWVLSLLWTRHFDKYQQILYENVGRGVAIVIVVADKYQQILYENDVYTIF